MLVPQNNQNKLWFVYKGEYLEGAVEEVVKLKIGAPVTQFYFPSVMRKIEKEEFTEQNFSTHLS